MNNDPQFRSIFVSGEICAGSGLRVAVKDVFDIAGETTTACSRALVGGQAATKDAEVIARLKNADCALGGRAYMHELASGVTGVNVWTGTPINPGWPRLIPGGSSSGSAAAAAAGLADFCVGTDTGGSIRMPAACCGVIGLKPTYGRVSRRGVAPETSSLDCVGPFATSMELIERAMRILCPDWQLGVDVPEAGAISVCWLETAADPEIATAVREVAGQLGNITIATLAGQDAAVAAGLALIGSENWHAFGHLVPHGGLGKDVRDRLIAASQISQSDVARAEAARQSFTEEVDALLARCDVLALPTLPSAVPTLEEAHDPAAIVPLTANVRPFNLTGHPAIALPVGESNGRPISLQLIGRRGADEKLCAIASRVQLCVRENRA